MKSKHFDTFFPLIPFLGKCKSGSKHKETKGRLRLEVDVSKLRCPSFPAKQVEAGSSAAKGPGRESRLINSYS